MNLVTITSFLIAIHIHMTYHYYLTYHVQNYLTMQSYLIFTLYNLQLAITYYKMQ